MTGSFVGIVTDVRGTDNPPSCLVRNEQTGRDAWYRIAPQVAPPIRVGERVRIVGGGDPDEPSATDPEPRVVGRAEPPSPPMPVATTTGIQPSAGAPVAGTEGAPAPKDPSVRSRADTIHMQSIAGGVRVSVHDPAGKPWSIVRRNAGGWTTDDEEEPRPLSAEAYAALDALVAVYRLAITHL
jgi:hypothetical protein